MGHRALLFLIVVFAGGLVASLLRVRDLSRQNAALVAQIQGTQAQTAMPANPDSKTPAAQNALGTAPPDASLADLRARIKAQSDAVAAVVARVNQLRGQLPGSGDPSADLATLQNKLAQEKQVIEDLEAHLKDLRAQESDTRSQDQYNQDQAGLTQKQAYDQLTAQIADQRQTLVQLRQQLADQKKIYQQNAFDLKAAQKIQDLQAQITAQLNAIQDSKDQRGNINDQWNFQKSQSHTLTHQQTAQLKAAEQDIRDQLDSARAVYKNLKAELDSATQGQSSGQAAIQNAEADYRVQKFKLDDLQNQLREAEIRSPQPGSPAGQ